MKQLQFSRHIANDYLNTYQRATIALNESFGKADFDAALSVCEHTDWLVYIWLTIAEILENQSHSRGY